jgi:transcription elongation GreA/GreB family factor
VAKALMGRRPGDEVDVHTPRGVRRQRVVRLGD